MPRTPPPAPETTSSEDIGRDPVIEVYKRDVDRSLLRENLRLTPLERLQKLTEHCEFLDRIRGAARGVERGGERPSDA